LVKAKQELRSEPARQKTATTSGTVIGLLVGLDEGGIPLVDYAGNAQDRTPARTTVPLSVREVGREVVLAFANGDRGQPLILGVVQRPGESSSSTGAIRALVDGESLVITGEQEITLCCGKASITLTKDGKVAIRGTYLLSRSSGVNRIQGGSIQLN
jgi:hypothetical protein